MYIFYYFLKRALTGETSKVPTPSLDYLGDVGEFIELDGIGYVIEDYAVEFGEVC